MHSSSFVRSRIRSTMVMRVAQMFSSYMFSMHYVCAYVVGQAFCYSHLDSPIHPAAAAAPCKGSMSSPDLLTPRPCFGVTGIWTTFGTRRHMLCSVVTWQSALSLSLSSEAQVGGPTLVAAAPPSPLTSRCLHVLCSHAMYCWLHPSLFARVIGSCADMSR